MTTKNQNCEASCGVANYQNAACAEAGLAAKNFTGAAFETADKIGIKGSRSTITFSRSSAELLSLTDTPTGLDFVAKKSATQLFDFLLEIPKEDNEITCIKPQTVSLEDDTFNLAAMADLVREKDSAIFINKFEAQNDAMTRIGIAADWWLTLYVNGEEVYASPSMSGNASGNFTTDCHIVEFPVKKGSNVIVAKIVNGTAGWRFVCGKPVKTPPRKGVAEAADLLSRDWKLYLHAQLPDDLLSVPEQLPQIAGPELHAINASSFTKISTRINNEKEIRFDFSEHQTMPLQVAVKVRQDELGLMRLSISITNSTKGIIRNIHFLRLVIPRELTAGKDLNDKIIAPSAAGNILVDDPWNKTKSMTGLYPYYMDVQFIAYYNDIAGLYMATYDGNGHYKKMSIALEKGDDIQMNIEHYQPEIPASDIQLSYETVLGTFNGDWYVAADLYKAWAVTQEWCVKTIDERNDLPSYFTEGAAVMAVPFLHEMPQYKLYPFEYIEKFPEIAEEYKKRTNLPHIGFVPMGWENRGAWAGINYFPALPSNKIWQDVNRKLKAQGDFTFMLPSGYKWVIKRQATELMGPEIDDSADFEKRKEMTVYSKNGKPWIHNGYEDTSYYGGITAKLCHSSSEAKATMRRIYKDITQLGVSIIQFDQEHGGAQDIPCYNPAHEHKPGYTNQFWLDFKDLCQKIIKDGKEICPDFGLSIEGCGEQSIPHMSTMWGRQCSEVDESLSGMQSLAMFSYIYHEFLPIIGDGFSVGQGMKATLGSAELRCFRLAKALVRGLIPTVYMEQVPLEPENEWQRKVSSAFISYCQAYRNFTKYLLKGITLRPFEINCATQQVWHYISDNHGNETLPDGRKASKVTIKRPTVIAGSFKASDNSIATIIANTTEQIQKAEVLGLPSDLIATVYKVDNTAESSCIKPQNKLSLELEPFGVRIIILETK